MYKCCWNCGNGFTCVAHTKEAEDRFNASKRFCCASYPVSNHGENPFKQRYCKQFDVPTYGVRFGHEITKEEAEKLNLMSVDDLVKYWKEDDTDETRICQL